MAVSRLSQWRPDVAVHGLWPAPFRAAVAAVLGLAADAEPGSAARYPQSQWWRLPPELVCYVLDVASQPRGAWRASSRAQARDNVHPQGRRATTPLTWL